MVTRVQVLIDRRLSYELLLQSKTEKEIEGERLAAENESSARLRWVYEAIGLAVTAHKVGTLLRWSCGTRTFPLSQSSKAPCSGGSMHPITNKVLQTERMMLRQMERGDVDVALMGIFSDPVAMRYYPTPRAARRRRSGCAGCKRAIEITASASGWQYPKTRASSWDSAASPCRR